VVQNGSLYTSADAGTTWMARAGANNLPAADNWRAVASSANGSNLVAVVNGGNLYTSADAGATWTTRTSSPLSASLSWSSVASSANGSNLVAVVSGGSLYTSADAGTTWTARTSSPLSSGLGWDSVASSANGSNLVGVVYGGNLYTSADAGTTWTARTSSPLSSGLGWYSVASSANGSNLVGVVSGGSLYTSADAGTTWTARTSSPLSASLNWQSVASSSNGSNLVGVVYGGNLYTSADAGTTWTARTSSPLSASLNWWSVASSANGSNLVAVVYGGSLYTSADAGTTWAAQTSSPLSASLNWYSVASSASGSNLVAVVQGGGLYTSSSAALVNGPSTIPGPGGALVGGQNAAIELLYVGSGHFMILSSVPAITAVGAGSDNASDAAYGSGWASGNNGGYGFQPWVFTTAGSGGSFFVGDSSVNGNGTSGNINTTGGRSWGIAANGITSASAVRALNAALAVGQTIKIDMDTGALDTGDRVSFGILSGANVLFEFYIGGGDGQYSIIDLSQTNSYVFATLDGLHLEFTLTAASAYSLAITPNGGSTTTLAGAMSAGAINGVRLLNSANGGSGASRNLYFNSLQIVP
jgi:photosystem II stability/assembly factor-like uncharacterized protein